MNTLIVDDNYEIRDALRSCFEHNSEINVVGECEDGIDVIPFLENNTVDTIIMDVKMPQMDGLKVMNLLRKSHPNIKVVIFSIYENHYNGIFYNSIIKKSKNKVSFVSKWEASASKLVDEILN